MEEAVLKIARRCSDTEQSRKGELDPAEGVRRRYIKNYPSVSSCISKRTKEGCGRGNEFKIVHSERGGEGPVLMRKPKWQNIEW